MKKLHLALHQISKMDNADTGLEVGDESIY